MSNNLTEKQVLFCREYLVDLNGAQAAIRAGYSKKSAKEQASRLLTNDNISARIQEMMNARSERTEITADYVLNGIKDLTERCVQATPVFDQDGNETGEWKFEVAGAFKGYELLGKHLQLFSEKINHSFDPNAPLTLKVEKIVRNARDNSSE